MELPKIDEDKLTSEAYWEYVEFLDYVEDTGCRCFISPSLQKIREKMEV